MKISVQQSWIETEPRHRFSEDFCSRLAQEINKRIQPAKATREKFPRYDAFIEITGKTRISKAKLVEIHDYGRPKLLRFTIALPHTGARRMDWPSEYPLAIEQFFVGVVAVLKELKIDGSRIAQDGPALARALLTLPKAEVIDDHLDMDEFAEGVRTGTIKVDAPAHAALLPRTLNKNLPAWKIPKGLAKTLQRDGMWESDRFDPVLLTVMSDTSYNGREIPMSWQIEFEPFDDRFKTANEKIKASGIEPDGDGWSEVIGREFARRYPKLAEEFHSDSESSTCVIWVESEKACQKLIEVAWSIMKPDSGGLRLRRLDLE